MLRCLTAGESHGECLSTILEGLPSGLKIDEAFINAELRRRQQSFGRSERQQIESDTIHLTAGIRKGETLGGPIAFTIKNKDFSIDRMPEVTRPRPGHADLVGITKYDRRDCRDILERASARETASRVAAGSVCKVFLREFGIEVLSYTVMLGGLRAAMEGVTPEQIKKAKEKSQLNCADPVMESEMIDLIRQATEQKDTLGGIFEVLVTGVPPGLGSHVQWDKKLDARLARALLSIQAIKGVEFGLGFLLGMMPGSEVHDEILHDAHRPGYKYHRKSNNMGGFEGGMTTGEPIVVRAVMKPISTLGSPLKTVDIITHEASEAAYERSDITAVPAAGIVGEAVVAFEMADAFLEKFGGDSMGEVRRNYLGYREQISRL